MIESIYLRAFLPETHNIHYCIQVSGHYKTCNYTINYIDHDNHNQLMYLACMSVFLSCSCWQQGLCVQYSIPEAIMMTVRTPFSTQPNCPEPRCSPIRPNSTSYHVCSDSVELDSLYVTISLYLLSANCS